MKGSQGDKQRLNHILHAIESIEQFFDGISISDFRNNYMLQLAAVKLLENIGEASNKLTPELRQRFPEVNWIVIIRSRNILVHEYFQIDLEIVWETIQQDLPTLKSQIQKISAMYE
jgi:uncharacterized protein with HEPN domain